LQNNDVDSDDYDTSNNDNTIDENSYSPFIELYEQAVTEALLIFGRHIKLIVSSYLKEKYSISRIGYTAANPKILLDALKRILNGGSKIAQRRILRLLYIKIDMEQSFDGTLDFEEKILKAIKEFENKRNYHSHYF